MVVTEKAQQFAIYQPNVFGYSSSVVSFQQVPQVHQMPQVSQVSPFPQDPDKPFNAYAPQEPYYNGQTPFTFYTSGQPLGELPGNLNYQMEQVQTGVTGQSVQATGEDQAVSLIDLLNDEPEAPHGASQDRGMDLVLRSTVPMYIPKPMMRGAGGGADKFFEPPYVSEHMTKNEDLIGILAHGSDEEVDALSNLSCACPPVKYKCDAAMDSALFVRTTHMLMTMHGVSSLTDVFRHVGMLGDRCCVQCKKPGMGCVAGTFQCINCLNKRGKLPFAEGFDMWMAGGQQARHAERM
jgi:hypothetical protein